tara:strand:- start:1365 stop:1583 length:219 start_codon:yes stop_codon:yes gene_type:complete
MSEDNIKWLLEEFPKFKGMTIRGEVLTAYYKAEMLLNNKEQINKRSCSCQLRGMAGQVDKSYSKWVSDYNNV